MSTVLLAKEKMAKFCGNCGNQLLDEDRVCGNCGKVVVAVSRSQGRDNKKVVSSLRQKLSVPMILGIVLVVIIGTIISNLFSTSYESVAKDVLKAIENQDVGLIQKHIWVPDKEQKSYYMELGAGYITETWGYYPQYVGNINKIQCRIIKVEEEGQEEKLEDIKNKLNSINPSRSKKLKKIVKVEYKIEVYGSYDTEIDEERMYLIQDGRSWKVIPEW